MSEKSAARVDKIGRRRNWRLVAVGGVLLNVLAPGFFLVMLTKALDSRDPATMMRTVGQVSGVIAAIGIVMMLVGIIGRKR